MTNKEKLEVLDDMLNCYVDRNYLTNKQIEESEEFIEELRETILVTRCCKSDSELLFCSDCNVDLKKTNGFCPKNIECEGIKVK